MSSSTAESTTGFLNILYSRPSSVRFKMRCKLLNTPAIADILCGIKWAYLSYELSLSQSHACAILNFDVSLFLHIDKWDGKFSRQKHTCWEFSHCYPPQWCQNLTKQHEEKLNQKAGGLGCQRIVTFCVAHHYDNEHWFSITSTSWAPFPLIYFSEGNGLWQSYLLHCIAGLFLEVSWNKICFSEYLWKSISKKVPIMYCWVLWEINSVLKVITSTCVPLLWPVCWLWICMIALWLTEQWWILKIKSTQKKKQWCNCAWHT